MPKSYSEQEKEYIRRRLKEEAANCIARYGIRRTTVDEIVRRVRIPKGTFYLFYQSKELLLFDVILKEHDRIEQEMFGALCSMDSASPDPKQLTDMILGFFRLSDQSPVLRALNPDEIELLARKLPQAEVEKHLKHDGSMMEKLFSIFPVNPETDMNAVGAAFRAVYLATLQKESIGEEYFEQALRLLINGLVLQLM